MAKTRIKKRTKTRTKKRSQSSARDKKTGSPIRGIPISILVLGETRLERLEVDKAKGLIQSGNWNPPSVLVMKFYFVRDGNHRIMAAKELGQKSVKCRIQQHKPKPNVRDYDQDECAKAIKAGLQGFKGIPIGSKEEKENEYADDDELILDFDPKGPTEQ